MRIHTTLACWWMGQVMSNPVIESFVNASTIALPACHVFWQLQSLICCMLALLCLLSFFFILQQCFVCLSCVVCAVLPSSSFSLPSPNIFGLQLECFALLPEFRLQSQKSSPAACISGDVEGGNQSHWDLGTWSGQTPSRLSRNADWMSFSCICQAPLLQPTTCMHTDTLRTTCAHARLKLTHLPLEDCWHYFFTSVFLALLHIPACTALLFCLSACYQSLSLSPFTFPPLSDVTPVFHFIPASCSLLINKQMTSPVLWREVLSIFFWM